MLETVNSDAQNAEMKKEGRKEKHEER